MAGLSLKLEVTNDALLRVRSSNPVIDPNEHYYYSTFCNLEKMAIVEKSIESMQNEKSLQL